MNKISKFLNENKDSNYADFINKLTPTLNRNYFIGVRVPLLRKLVKELNENEKESFIKELPHKYYEENLLHGFIISSYKDYGKTIYEINRFLPYINNWATCDTTIPKIFSKHKDELLLEIKKWIKSKETYVIRFSISMLMKFYLDDNFNEDIFKLVNNVKSNEYYVNIMKAWFYAEALNKHYDVSIKVIESKMLDKWVHNKAIQKAIESRRISDCHKNYLRKLKIK